MYQRTQNSLDQQAHNITWRKQPSRTSCLIENRNQESNGNMKHFAWFVQKVCWRNSRLEGSLRERNFKIKFWVNFSSNWKRKMSWGNLKIFIDEAMKCQSWTWEEMQNALRSNWLILRKT